MPLILELQIGDNWLPVGTHQPGAQTGSMSNITEGGDKEIILFDCRPDDQESTVRKATRGMETKVTDLERALVITHDEVLATLKDGESHTMDIQTERMPRAFPTRFTHRKA